MYNPQKRKKQAKLFWRFFSYRSISRACDHPFYYQSKLFEKEPILFEKSQQSFFFLSIPLSLLLIYYYSATYKKKKQIFLLYLSIYYWFYSFYYITILMHLKKMITTLQKQKSIKFSKKTKPHMQKFCPRKESKKLIILTSLNLLQKP